MDKMIRTTKYEELVVEQASLSPDGGAALPAVAAPPESGHAREAMAPGGIY